MPNEWVKTVDTTNNQYIYTYEADQAQPGPTGYTCTLATVNKFVDKNIKIKTIIPTGSLQGSTTTVSANAVNAGSLLTQVSTAPANDPYITVTGQGTVTVNTPGWIASNVSQTSTSGSVIYQVTKGAYTVEDISTDRVNGTITPSLNLETIATKSVSQGGLGFTSTKPSGTTGVDYLTLDPNATVTTAWSVTPHATITTGGYIGTGEKSGTVISASPTINNGTNYYVPIVAVTVSGGGLSITSNYEKNDLSVSFEAGRTTSTYRNITASSVRVGTKNTTTYPYFFEIHGTTDAISGTTTAARGAITYSNNAGAIAQNVNTQAFAGDSVSPTVSVNAANSYTYFSMKKADVAITASTAAPTIQKINLSTNGVSGKTQILSTIDLIQQSSYTSGIDTYYIAVKGFSGAVTQGTPSIATEGYLKETSSIRASGVAAGTETDIYYLPVPTATFVSNNGAVTVQDSGYVAEGTSVINLTTAQLNAVTTDPGNSYPEITQNVSITSGGYLKIDAGYITNGKISLATLIGDDSHVAGLAAGYILSGHSAYDNAGLLIAGSILTYDGTFTIP